MSMSLALIATALCGRHAHYNTGDHDLIRRLAIGGLVQGEDTSGYCARCLDRLRTTLPVSAADAGRIGGTARAARLTPAQHSEAGRVAAAGRWIKRPVLAVRHDADGRAIEGWPMVGTARTWSEAIRLVREAGYRVPSRRTPGWIWEMVPAEVAKTAIGAFGVPCRPVLS